VFLAASTGEATEQPAAGRFDTRADELEGAGVHQEAPLAAFNATGACEENAIAGLQRGIELRDEVATLAALE
jgi:hypothetical protein